MILQFPCWAISPEEAGSSQMPGLWLFHEIAVQHGRKLIKDMERSAISRENPIDNLNVPDTNQEHGIIGDRFGHSLDLSKFPVGTTLRILPNHACATATEHSQYHVIREGTVLEAVWERFNGW